MRPVDMNMTSTDGCARDVMAITRMRFAFRKGLGRTWIVEGRVGAAVVDEAMPEAACIDVKSTRHVSCRVLARSSEPTR
jgi:hypothetical protein